MIKCIVKCLPIIFLFLSSMNSNADEIVVYHIVHIKNYKKREIDWSKGEKVRGSFTILAIVSEDDVIEYLGNITFQNKELILTISDNASYKTLSQYFDLLEKSSSFQYDIKNCDNIECYRSTLKHEFEYDFWKNGYFIINTAFANQLKAEGRKILTKNELKKNIDGSNFGIY